MRNGNVGLPSGFVYLDAHVPGLILDIRYHGPDNFLGRPVPGYEAPVCILTLEAAEALKGVQAEAALENRRLKILDGYRPQCAVDEFIRWSQDADDQIAKAGYYPNLDKRDLFDLGYLARRSSHSRGSTVDLTIIDAQGLELDFGTPFDLFDLRSHTANDTISSEAAAHRQWLLALMEKHGFANIPEEWWHFTLKSEPFPNTYHNFPVR